MLPSIKLTHKILIFLLATAGLLIIISWILSHKIEKESNSLLLQKLNETKEEEMPRIVKISEGIISNIITDYSSWTQTAEFAEGKRDNQWAQDELQDPLSRYGIHHIWVFDNSGKVLFSASPHFNDTNITFTNNNKLFDSLKNSSYLKFYHNIGDETLEVFGSTITNTEDLDFKFKVKGYLFVSREVNEAYYGNLKALTSDIKFEAVSTSTIKNLSLQDEINNGQFSFYYPLKKFDNTPIAYIKVSRGYPVLNKYQSFISDYLMMFLVIITSIGIGFYLLAKQFILLPFEKITNALSQKKKEILLPLSRRNDEFGSLSKLMIQSFDQQNILEAEIKTRQETERSLLDAIQIQKNTDAEKTRVEYYFKEQNNILQVNTFNKEQTFDDSINKVIQLTASTLKCERIGVWIFNEQRKSIVPSHSYSLSQDKFGTIKEESFEAESPIYFKKLKTSIIVVNDVSTSPDTQELLEDYLKPNNITSLLDIPIKNENRVIGVVCCEHIGEPKEWSINEQIFVSSVTNIVALQIEKEERRKAEILLLVNQERFEESQKLAHIGSWSFSFINLTTTWSKEMYRIFEVEESASANLFNEFKTSVVEEDLPLLNDAVSIIQNNSIQCEVQLRIMTKDNQIKYINAIGDPILSKNSKKLIGLKGSVQDITAQKLADLAKSEFLSTMSHEIRTPINGVIGIANLLLGEELNERQAEYVETLNYSAKHLATVVSDILDFSKIESGFMSFEKSSFNLEKNCKYIFELFKSIAAEHNIEYSFTPQKIDDYSLYGDSVRLNQILSNLLSNAIKFTKKGSVHFSYKVLEDNNHTIKVRFTVTDTGIGIPKSSQALVFDSFRQADKNTTRKFGGSGLGLTICKKLIELQGGTIALKSVEGKGTSFYVELSFEKHVYKNKAQQLITPEPIHDTKMIHGLKILIAEDNKINAMVLSRFLQKWGVSFEVAKNGLEAINLLENNPFDMILMDIQMPIMDGIEATKAIRKNKDEIINNIPIIAFTADASVDTHKRLLKNGFTHCMTKPFDPDELFKYLLKMKKSLADLII